jgi:hypothetical protein
MKNMKKNKIGLVIEKIETKYAYLNIMANLQAG